MGVQKGRRATTDKRKRCLNYKKVISKKQWTTGLLETRTVAEITGFRKHTRNLKFLAMNVDFNGFDTASLCTESFFINEIIEE